NPSEGDNTRSRWPQHPLWSAIWQAGCTLSDQPSLTRNIILYNRAPVHWQVMQQFASVLSSWMALHGITDIRDNCIKYLFDDWPNSLLAYKNRSGIPLEEVLAQKARQKIRLYNIRPANHQETLGL